MKLKILPALALLGIVGFLVWRNAQARQAAADAYRRTLPQGYSNLYL